MRRRFDSRGREPRPARPLAVVMGDLNVVRALAIEGIRSAAFNAPGHPVHHSRHVRAVLDWADSWAEPERTIDILLAFARSQPLPPVLFPQTDPDVLAVSRHRSRLEGALRCALADADLVEALLDKARFQALAARLGLGVPPAVVLRSGEPAGPLDLRFPLVVKPLTRTTATWTPLASPGKARRVGGAAELERLRRRLADLRLDALAQELVPGPETRLVSYHAYVDARGRIAGEFTGRKIRTLPAEYGHSTAVEITTDEELLAAGRDVVRRIGLRGVAKLDFKRDPAGCLHLLEINPRFSLWHHPGAIAGVNLPALAFADLTGAALPPARPARPGVRWCRLRDDARAARAQGEPLARWLAFALRCEANETIAIDDPLPNLRAHVLAPALARLTRRDPRRG